ncbi:DHH family phosphoesterase [Proteinivorax hydrogeniformans]|uniref:DHH family phosphoesterase n=1 Tax=Proteinivorax hydrogeniformans TaxID=1826727 RepID=A0AAU8HSU1_9FIRM
MNSMDNFINFLQKYEEKDILILCHDDADNDAIGAGFALTELLGGTLAVPQKISEHAIELIKKLAAKVIVNPDPAKYDLTIVVDTADGQQLPNISLDNFLLIDHHPTNTLKEKAMSYIHEEVDATCQLVYALYKHLEKPITPAVALSLAAGILGDTVQLTKASNNAISDLGSILQDGNIGYSTVLNTFRVSGKLERKQKLIAATSAKLHDFDDVLLIFSNTEKNFLYYTAMMFLELGADIALVVYKASDWIHLRLVKSNHCLTSHSAIDIIKEATKEAVIENLWGDQYFSGFKGRGDYAQIISTIFEKIKDYKEETEEK